MGSRRGRGRRREPKFPPPMAVGELGFSLELLVS